MFLKTNGTNATSQAASIQTSIRENASNSKYELESIKMNSLAEVQVLDINKVTLRTSLHSGQPSPSRCESLALDNRLISYRYNDLHCCDVIAGAVLNNFVWLPAPNFSYFLHRVS